MNFTKQFISLDHAIAALTWTPTGDSPSGEAIGVWYTYTGQGEDEVANWGWLSALHPDDREQAAQEWFRSIQTQRMHSTFYRVRRFDGSYTLFKIRAIPRFDLDHHLNQWLVWFTDTTRMQPVEEGWECRSLYHLLFKQAVMGVSCVALDGRILRVNEHICRLLGYREDELLALSIWDITHPDDLSASSERINALLSGQIPSYTFQKRYIHKQGYPIWVKATVTLIAKGNGEPQYMISIFEDISERIQAEEKRAQLFIDEQEARAQAVAHMRQLEAIFESMADGVLVYDSAGNITHANTAVRKRFDLDIVPGSLNLPLHERAKILIVLDKNSQPYPVEQRPSSRVLRGEKFYDELALASTVRTPAGNTIQVSISGAPIYDQENRITGGVLVFRDVTEGRQLEQRIQKAFSALLTLAQDMVDIAEQPIDKDTAPDVAIGQQISELIGHTLGYEAIGVGLLDPQTGNLDLAAYSGINPDSKEIFEQEIKQATLADYLDEVSIERLYANKIVLRDLIQEPFIRKSNYGLQKVLFAPMFLGERFSGLLIVGKQAPAVDYTWEEMALLKTVARFILPFIEHARLRHEWIEVRANELALQEANRRFEEFISIAGHELRTPLTTINGNIQLALRRMRRMQKENQTEKISMEHIEERIRQPLVSALQRIEVQSRMINDLLDVTRIQANKLTFNMQTVNLVKIVHDMVKDQRHTTPERVISLEVSARKEIMVMADVDRISQVVQNYLSNAIKYSAPDKPVIVHVEVENGLARVSVKDKGPGLPLKEQQRIWERFYRAPGIEVQSGSGTGLGMGLHICRTIIQAHGGKVGVNSAPGKGSTFWFTLPLAAEA